MTIYSWLILAFWLLLLVTWAVLAGRAKRTTDNGGRWWREIALRLAILVVVLLVVRSFSHAPRNVRLYAVNRSTVAGFIGVVLCALGVGLAILARIHLGRNWGLPMSRKENPELVTTGPYATIRHPIYTGIFLAAFGSAISQGVLWLLPLFILGPYFFHSARREEQFLITQFPEQYPAYMRRTKMLLPYVL